MASIFWDSQGVIIIIIVDYLEQGCTINGAYYAGELERLCQVLLDFSLTVKAATLIFISGCGSAISSAKEGKSGFIYNLVKS